MPTAVCKWFNSQKGYGFLSPDADGPDVFVHMSVITRSGLTGLNEGQRVSYEERVDPKNGKMSASKIALLQSVRS